MIMTSIRAAHVDLLPLSLGRRWRLQRAKHWSGPAVQFMELPEATIRYCVAGGPGPTLVISPDPPVMIEHYQDLIDRLLPHFKVVVFEQPGFGFSLPRRSLRMNLQGATAVVARFLDGLGLGPYVLSFPCIAGFSALNLAHRRPDLVRAIVVTQTGSREDSLAWRSRVDPRGILATPVAGQLFLRSWRNRVMRAWFHAALGDARCAPAFIEISDNAFRHGACFCLASALQEYLTEALPEFAPPSCPTLVVWGEKDRTHRQTEKNRRGSFARGAKLVTFADAGHFPDLESPERFARELTTFLQEHFPEHARTAT